MLSHETSLSAVLKDAATLAGEVGKLREVVSGLSEQIAAVREMVEGLVQLEVLAKIDDRMAVLIQAIDEAREEVAWVARNAQRSHSEQPIVHVTSMPRDPVNGAVHVQLESPSNGTTAEPQAASDAAQEEPGLIRSKQLAHPFSLACETCDTDIECQTIEQAVAVGWKSIQEDAEAPTSNYLGICPECQAKGDDAAPPAEEQTGVPKEEGPSAGEAQSDVLYFVESRRTRSAPRMFVAGIKDGYVQWTTRAADAKQFPKFAGAQELLDAARSQVPKDKGLQKASVGLVNARFIKK